VARKKRRGAEGDEDREGSDMGGMTVWKTQRDGESLELIARDRIIIEGDRVVWHINHPKDPDGAPPIESTDPSSVGFARRMTRRRLSIARRNAPLRTVSKPTARPKRRLPNQGPVPCPLCRPNATKESPGEALPDCECCDGDGFVSDRQAREWFEQHS
jgi:hypothetical protein